MQTAVTAYFSSKQLKSKQLLLFFLCITALRQAAVTAYGGQYASTRWQKRIL